jgi:hypothetical protein
MNPCPSYFGSFERYLDYLGISGRDSGESDFRSEFPVAENPVGSFDWATDVVRDVEKHIERQQEARQQNNSDLLDMDPAVVELLLRLVEANEKMATSLLHIERLLDKRLHRHQ